MLRHSSKTTFFLLIAVALVAISAFVVAAQDDNTTPTAPYGPGWMHTQDNADYGPGWMHTQDNANYGPGWMHTQDNANWRPGMRRGHGTMMGYGFGQEMMWGEGNSMMFTIAEVLGLEPDALFTALQDGQTFAEIAEAQGVELDTVTDAIFVESEAHMSALVEAGTITQEQADEHLTWMRDNIATMPMFSGSGFGPCMGEQANFGMMGRGQRRGN